MRDQSKTKRLVRSFTDAGDGILSALRTERNFRIHASLLVVVVMLGFVLDLSGTEWVAVILAAGLVVASELVNTALEYLADALHPESDPGVGRAKDAAAGAVLVAALAAAAVGAIVFAPKLWKLLPL